MASDPKPHDRTPIWLALAGIAGAIIGAAITGWFSYFGHQRDLDAKMIELSVGILRAEPKAETEPLREWAIDIIEKRAHFAFNAAQRAILLKRQLPFFPSYTNSIDWRLGKDGKYFGTQMENGKITLIPPKSHK